MNIIINTGDNTRADNGSGIGIGIGIDSANVTAIGINAGIGIGSPDLASRACQILSIFSSKYSKLMC